MKIVADQAIADVADVFAPLGELVLLPGRDIGPGDVRDADALLVRTITRVDETLLAGSRVQFVGSAASGTDHIDQDYLAAHAVRCCSAPGCNADAVVNYVMAALAWLELNEGVTWRDRPVGIMGAGNVGSRLATLLLSLGMEVRVHDPFLAANHPLAGSFATLDDVLACRLVSLHVPLTDDGPHPTWHVLGNYRLAQLAPETVLINAARGEVVDNNALLALLETRADLTVALDVWEFEPDIDSRLLARVAIGTPHIAGYSLNGKRNATRMVYEGLCEHFQLPPSAFNEKAAKPVIEAGSVSEAVLKAYPIEQDFLSLESSDLGAEFERRRNGYHFRREFRDCCFKADDWSVADSRVLKALGFVAQ